MRDFYYCVRDRYSGEMVRGVVRAADEREAADMLRRQHYLIISLRRYSLAKVRILWRKMHFRRALGGKNLIVLCRQISVMLNAGIGLRESLEIAAKSKKNSAFKQFIRQSIEGLHHGSSLSEIWQSHDYGLPGCLISSLQVAEHSGMMAQCLHETALYLQKRAEEKHKLRQICIYPAFLLIVLIVISCIMLCFVLPMFQSVFARMNVKLPLITQFILDGAVLLKDNIMYIVLILGLMSLGCMLAWQKDDCRLVLWRVFGKMPFCGDFWQKTQLAGLFYQLSYLLKSGIALDQSLQIVYENTHNIYIRHCLKQINDSVRHGFSLSQSFVQSGIGNSAAVQLISVGEFTGTLVQSLAYGCDLLTGEIDEFVCDFMRMAEPLMMVIAGIIVGVFVISIVLPLFEMVSSIGI